MTNVIWIEEPVWIVSVRQREHVIMLPVTSLLQTSSMSRPARLRLAMNRWRHASSLPPLLSPCVSSTAEAMDDGRLVFSSYTSTKSILRRPSLKKVELSAVGSGAGPLPSSESCRHKYRLLLISHTDTTALTACLPATATPISSTSRR
jgi:hypothetical protein